MLYMTLSVEQSLDEAVMMTMNIVGRVFLWTTLVFYCNTMACGTSRQSEKFSIYGKTFKEMQAIRLWNSIPQIGYCNMEKKCDWVWTVFKNVKASSTSAPRDFPKTDASNSSSGTKIFGRLNFFFFPKRN